jgi:hypothetical protein
LSSVEESLAGRTARSGREGRHHSRATTDDLRYGFRLTTRDDRCDSLDTVSLGWSGCVTHLLTAVFDDEYVTQRFHERRRGHHKPGSDTDNYHAEGSDGGSSANLKGTLCESSLLLWPL